MTPARTNERLTKDELRSILVSSSDPVLTIHFPTARIVVEPEENSLRLKNLLARGETELADRGLRRTEVDALVEPLSSLLQDTGFWQHQMNGLVLFRDRDRMRYYKLPFEPPEEVVVQATPYVRHLFRGLYPEAEFYLLGISQHAVRLLHCTAHDCRELDLSDLDIPRTLEDALRYDDLQKPELQHHPTTGPGRGRVGGISVESPRGERRHAFHGHGADSEESKTQLRRFLQAVDHGICKLLGSKTTPLILIGVEYVRSLYKQVSGYRYIADAGVDASPDRLRDGDLHELAYPVIDHHLRRDVDAVKDRFRSALARNLASNVIPDVLAAAHDGRVDTLFVHGDARLWGRFDDRTRELEQRHERRPGDVDLIDEAARAAFLNAGVVFVLDGAEAVDPSPLAAIFRY